MQNPHLPEVEARRDASVIGMPFEKRSKQSRQLRLLENVVLHDETAAYDFAFYFVREHQNGFVKSTSLFMYSKRCGEDCSQSCGRVLVVDS